MDYQFTEEQQRVLDCHDDRIAVVTGRRWGKSLLADVMANKLFSAGQSVLLVYRNSLLMNAQWRNYGIHSYHCTVDGLLRRVDKDGLPETLIFDEADFMPRWIYFLSLVCKRVIAFGTPSIHDPANPRPLYLFAHAPKTAVFHFPVPVPKGYEEIFSEATLHTEFKASFVSSG